MITGSFTLIGIQDAILVESCYKATQQNVTPSTPASSQDDGDIPEGWSGTLISVSASMPYVWESQRTKDGNWSAWSTPVLKNSWGKQGAKLRMRTWSEGTEFLPGSDGEEFYDVGEYNAHLYLCLKKHVAQDGVNDPITSINKNLGYWGIAQEWTFIATKLLLAEKIKAEQIDANGITAKDVDLTGRITATSGKIGGWTIDGDNLTCNGFDTKLNIEASPTRFLRINNSPTELMYLRAEGSTGISIATYGNSNATVGLSIACNAAGYGYAIQSYGNVQLHARNSEFVSIKGLSVNVRAVSASQDVYTNDDYIFASGDITLKLPAPQSMPGKVYHIRKGTGTVTLTSYYMSGIVKPFYLKDGRNDYSTTITTNDMHSYISSGTAWYEMIS